jgi:hypothetical protein
VVLAPVGGRNHWRPASVDLLTARRAGLEPPRSPPCSCGRSGHWLDAAVIGTCPHLVEALRLRRAWLEAVVSEDAVALDALVAGGAALWGNERPRRRSFVDPSPDRFAQDVATIAERRLAVLVLHAFARALEDEANLGRPLEAILADIRLASDAQRTALREAVSQGAAAVAAIMSLQRRAGRS